MIIYILDFLNFLFAPSCKAKMRSVHVSCRTKTLTSNGKSPHENAPDIPRRADTIQVYRINDTAVNAAVWTKLRRRGLLYYTP